MTRRRARGRGGEGSLAAGGTGDSSGVLTRLSRGKLRRSARLGRGGSYGLLDASDEYLPGLTKGGSVKWFRRRRAGEAVSVAGSGEAISLGGERAINLGLIRDLYALLVAIDEVMPAGAVLYLEGTSIVPNIQAFLETHQAQESQLVVRGTLWPRPKTYHLPLTGSNLSQLRELAERHAEPEICDHLVVYRGDEVLVSAYDAGSSHVYVSRDLPPETVEGLRRRLGVA